MSAGYVNPTHEQLELFDSAKREGPIHMLNLVRLRERAAYEDGREATGEQAYGTYGRASAEPFRRVGGRIVWLGEFEQMFIGPTAERWDRAFIAEYPSSEAFQAMLADPAYREAVKHREAAVLDSRLIRLKPIGKGAPPGG